MRSERPTRRAYATRRRYKAHKLARPQNGPMGGQPKSKTSSLSSAEVGRLREQPTEETGPRSGSLAILAFKGLLGRGGCQKLDFGTESSALLGAGVPSSYAQYGQNLSVSTTSRLQLGQEGWRLHLQLGQKLKRPPTLVPHCGQG